MGIFFSKTNNIVIGDENVFKGCNPNSIIIGRPRNELSYEAKEWIRAFLEIHYDLCGGVDINDDYEKEFRMRHSSLTFPEDSCGLYKDCLFGITDTFDSDHQMWSIVNEICMGLTSIKIQNTQLVFEYCLNGGHDPNYFKFHKESGTVLIQISKSSESCSENCS